MLSRRSRSPYVAKPLTSANTAQGLYGKERFTYQPEQNAYVCPAGRELTYRFSTHEKGRPIHYYRASDCQSCPLRSHCTRNQANRTIIRLALEEIQEAMAVRVKANPPDHEAAQGDHRTLLRHDQTNAGLLLLPLLRLCEGADRAQFDRAGL